MQNTQCNEHLLVVSAGSFVIGAAAYYLANQLWKNFNTQSFSQEQEIITPNVPPIDVNQIENQQILTSDIVSPTSNAANTLPSETENLADFITEKIGFMDTILSSKIHLYDNDFLNLDSFTSHLNLLAKQVCVISKTDPEVLIQIFTNSVPYLLCPMAIYSLLKPLHQNEVYKNIISTKISKSNDVRIDKILLIRMFGGLGVKPSKISLEKFNFAHRMQIEATIVERQRELVNFLNNTQFKRGNFKFKSYFK